MTPILATYLIESPEPLEKAVDKLISEQTIGSFVEVPGEADLKTRFRGQVIALEPLETADSPALVGRYGSAETFQRGKVTVAIPAELVAGDFFTLLAALLGNIYELKELSGLRLLEVELPPELAAHYPMPQFGVEGTRRLANVYGRPVIGSIIKPSVGLTPEQTADMVRELVEAGIDFIKDDELMTGPEYSPFARRVEAVMRVINDHADRTGKKAMFAFNITHDHVETMLRNHDTVLAAGGTCIMFSINHVGFAGAMHIRRHSQLPIHAHRNGWGMFTRAPGLGMDFKVYQALWRLVGVDQLHVNGIRNKFWEPDESVVRSIEACLTPMFSDDRLMPVISSGQWGGQAPDTFRQIKTVDVMYLAGGGIQGHPDGPTGGVAAIRQAWEAAMQGIALEEYAAGHPELRHALEKFGKRE